MGDLEGAMCIIFDNVPHNVSIVIVLHGQYIHTLHGHTLHGQYESFTGNSHAIFRKQVHFKRLWDSMLIFREDGIR